jgi:glycerol-3-phosphate dehydrogenase
MLRRLGRLYGTRARKLLGPARSLDDLGRQFGAQFYEAEARYLCDHEWAVTPEDILKRRTKEGLHLTSAQTAAFEEWFQGTLRKSA